MTLSQAHWCSQALVQLEAPYSPLSVPQCLPHLLGQASHLSQALPSSVLVPSSQRDLLLLIALSLPSSRGVSSTALRTLSISLRGLHPWVGTSSHARLGTSCNASRSV